jgi:single-strand DNA-binding protein
MKRLIVRTMPRIVVYHALNVAHQSKTEGIMSSLNRVTLIGHLGADPETRAFSDGGMVCNLRIATSESWKDRVTGEQRESTEWHRVVFYRRLAEIAEQFLRKGAQVYVEGKLRTKKWTDKTGAERYSTDIEGVELKMLGKASQATTPSDLPPPGTRDNADQSVARARDQVTTARDPFENDPFPF